MNEMRVLDDGVSLEGNPEKVALADLVAARQEK
jgi:hypothetical protein